MEIITLSGVAKTTKDKGMSMHDEYGDLKLSSGCVIVGEQPMTSIVIEGEVDS